MDIDEANIIYNREQKKLISLVSHILELSFFSLDSNVFFWLINFAPNITTNHPRVYFSDLDTFGDNIFHI